MKPQWENTPEDRLKLYKAMLERIKEIGVKHGLCHCASVILQHIFDIDEEYADIIAQHEEGLLYEFNEMLPKAMYGYFGDNGCLYCWPRGESAPRIEFLESVIAKMESDGIN